MSANTTENVVPFCPSLALSESETDSMIQSSRGPQRSQLRSSFSLSSLDTRGSNTYLSYSCTVNGSGKLDEKHTLIPIDFKSRMIVSRIGSSSVIEDAGMLLISPSIMLYRFDLA